jgi:hypothetical protein
MLKKKIWANFQRFVVYPKNFQYALKYLGLGSGIRDPGSGKNLFPIPDPEVKKAPDPGSATLVLRFPDPNPHLFRSLRPGSALTIWIASRTAVELAKINNYLHRF